MPLSFVLHATFARWHRALERVFDWNKIIDLEAILVGRARGAFMARWFGNGLPLHLGELRVVVANIDELRARYHELRRQARSAASDLDLTEPLAGIAGTLAGSLLSPVSSMVLFAVIDEQLPHWYTTLAGATNALTFGALSALVGALLVPAAVVALPYWALNNPAQASAAHGFLRALAGLLVSAREFLLQVSGPRDQVRNPLLGQVLDLLGGVAKLLPFVFALGAFAITWLGPRLAPLARFVDAMVDVVSAVAGLIGEAVADLSTRLGELYEGPASVTASLLAALGALGGWWAGLQARIHALGKSAGKPFEAVAKDMPRDFIGPAPAEWRVLHELKSAFGGDKFRDALAQATSRHWFILRVQEIGARLGRIVDILGRLEKHTPKAEPKPGLADKIKNREIGKLLEALPERPATLKFPDMPKLFGFPSIDEMLKQEQLKLPGAPLASSHVLEAFKRPGGGTAFALDAGASKALDALRRPPASVLGADQAALQRAMGGHTPAQFLQEAHAAEATLRGQLFAVIDRLLPAAVGDEVPKLQGALWEIDGQLYGEPAPFPVRDLPGGDALNVKVGRVRVRAPGHHRHEVRTWSDTLKAAIAGQRFGTLAPAAA